MAKASAVRWKASDTRCFPLYNEIDKFTVRQKRLHLIQWLKWAYLDWILGWHIWTNRTPGRFLSGGVAGCMGFPDFHCIPGRLGDIFCGGWRTRSFKQWTSRITGYLHFLIILMAITVNMNEFQTFAVVVFGGECDVVVVGANDFGWLWMPLFCPKIGLRINNNRGHVTLASCILGYQLNWLNHCTEDASWAFRLERLWLDFCHSVLPSAGLWYASMVMVQWKGFPIRKRSVWFRGPIFHWSMTGGRGSFHFCC